MGLAHKLQKLEQLANRMGYTIAPGKENLCEPGESRKRIVLNTRQAPIKRAWVLAHEIGHAKTYKKCMQEIGDSACGPEHEWPSLEWEFRAWREADKLIRKLGLFSREYMKYKHSCLRSYYTNY